MQVHALLRLFAAPQLEWNEFQLRISHKNHPKWSENVENTPFVPLRWVDEAARETG